MWFDEVIVRSAKALEDIENFDKIFDLFGGGDFILIGLLIFERFQLPSLIQRIGLRLFVHFA